MPLILRKVLGCSYESGTERNPCQVQEMEGGASIRSEIVYRPAQPPPLEMYSQLGLHRPRSAMAL